MAKSQRNHPQIKSVTNFHDLMATPFSSQTNAMCWKRDLDGNFAEIINQFKSTENMIVIDMDELSELELSKQGQLARAILIEDFEHLKTNGASPTLNVIKQYERDTSYPFFPTDVYSFHVDRSPIPTSTFLCTYHGAASEILPNTQAVQKILEPNIRAELLKLYDGPDHGFESFLKEYFFDLHYQPTPNAQPINLGNGHLWKLAVDHPNNPVLPCVHRAPKEKPGESRLLMIC